MGRHLSEEDTATIIKLYYNENLTQSQIAARLNCAQKTISNKLAIFESENRISRKKTVRPIKAIDDVLVSIGNHVDFDPGTSLRELREELCLPYAKSTISSYIKRTGRKCFISPRKFLVRSLPVEQRVEWASINRYMTVDEWHKIVFTDESGLDNSGFFRKHVWRPRGERFNQRYVIRHANRTLSRVNFFSYVTIRGTGKLYFYERMNSETYCDIISDMINQLKAQFGSNDFRVIHDNAKFSVSKFTKEYFAQNDLERYFMTMPAYSPDINIIENFWSILKDRTKKHCYRDGQTLDRDDFLDLIVREWSGIEQSTCENAYSSLPGRMRSIIRAEGQLEMLTPSCEL